jgi:3-methyladenine DNA glycosylase Mpg
VSGSDSIHQKLAQNSNVKFLLLKYFYSLSYYFYPMQDVVSFVIEKARKRGTPRAVLIRYLRIKYRIELSPEVLDRRSRLLGVKIA